MTEQYVYVYGIHAINALLNNPHRKIKTVFLSEEREDKRFQALIEQIENLQINIEKLSSKEMNQRFSDLVHQGIIASASPVPEYNESHLPGLLKNRDKSVLVLVLDGITDPHNLGACLRTADATGVDLVIIPKDKNVGITPVVSKVACGAAEIIPVVRVTNLVRSMEFLKQEGVWIYGAAGEASTSLYQIKWSGDTAIVMGAEGSGLRRLTREHCDGLFYIPMAGSVSSLNVSVAAAVSLYEVTRQKGEHFE